MGHGLIKCLVSLGVAAFVGCAMENNGSTKMQDAPKMPAGKVAVAEMKPSKAATTMPSNTDVHGTITLTQVGDKVHITGMLMGLAPNTKHGFHIHEKGDISAADLMSTGGHFNPDKHQHGAPDAAMHHAGDFGNVTSDASGMAMIDLTTGDISIGGEKNNVVGLAFIVHAKEDNLQPNASPGARVAGGLIELKK